MLNKVSLFAFSLGLLGLLLARRCSSFIPSFRSVIIVPLLGESGMVTLFLYCANFMHVLLLSSDRASSVILCYNNISDFSVINICMGSFALQIDCSNMIPLEGQSLQEQHSQNVTRKGHTRHNKVLVMGVEAADLSHWVLHSTEAELCDCFEVPEKLGDSCRTKGIGQGSPHGSRGCCDEISDVQGTSELDLAIGHQVRQSQFLELYWVCWHHSSATNDQPQADRTEIGAHLSSSFPIVCPIKDGDVGGDRGGCLVVRHYKKIKASVTGPSTE